MADDGVVIAGAGHAGFQVAASLRQHGFDGNITLLGDEPPLPYQRPPLSKEYLDGKIGLDLLLMRPEAFYRDHRIDYLAGAQVSTQSWGTTLPFTATVTSAGDAYSSGLVISFQGAMVVASETLTLRNYTVVRLP